VALDSGLPDNPGTILDGYEGVPLLGGLHEAQPWPNYPGEKLYTSPYRWTAPRILICDDGSLDSGELIYIRSDRTTIGRTTGEVTIGHDIAMSASHAEIVREDYGGQHAWVLRDLNSRNGTLARVKRVTIDPGQTILLGSKRFHFEPAGPGMSLSPGGPPAETIRLDHPAGISESGQPALVENTSPHSPGGQRHPFQNLRIKIGLPGFGNEIELDDPCIAPLHAVIERDASGAWQLEAKPSLNGVWVRLGGVRLIDGCLFQCGEQRFRFLL
jgi:pSer/pThr/pTyr-binding forkhead associated (FHA) protein